MKFFRSGSGGSSRWAAAWVLMAALVWSASSARADSGSAQAQANKEAVNKAFAAWAAGGRTFFDDMLAPNVVWTIKGSSPTARVLRGKQALIDGAVTPLSTRLQRQIRPTIRNLWADGDHVIIEWDGEAVAKDGKPYLSLSVKRKDGTTDRPDKVSEFKAEAKRVFPDAQLDDEIPF